MSNITDGDPDSDISRASKNPFNNESINQIDPDNDDEIPVALTASYSEISFSSNMPYLDIDVEKKSETMNKKKRPDSLNCQSVTTTAPSTLPSSSSVKRKDLFPYNLEGTVTLDGNMTHFITENLEHKIKLSSPVTKTNNYNPTKESYQSGGSHTSTPSATTHGGSNLITRQFLLSSHNQLPQIDSNVLNDVEIESQYLAASVDNLTENLCNLLHSISSITADNVETYKNAVNKLTDCMDSNIKSMYTIMAKTEEITNAIKPTEQLGIRIREIKRLVEMLENNL